MDVDTKKRRLEISNLAIYNNSIRNNQYMLKIQLSSASAGNVVITDTRWRIKGSIPPLYSNI